MPDDVHVGHRSVKLDPLDAMLRIPVSRLDADQYSAEDIDGATESIFGSGNMAYASLQASQIDASVSLNEALNLETDQGSSHESGIFSGSTNAAESADARAMNVFLPGHGIPTDTDRTLDSGDTTGTESIGAAGNFSHTTVGAIGASVLFSDAESLSFSSSISPEGNAHFDNGAGSNISTATTTINNNVINNVNVDDTVENIVNTINETINNITNLGDEVIENILEGDIGEIVNIVNNQLSELTETITTEINNITDTVNTILQNSAVTEVTNQVTEVTNEITEIVTNTVNEVLGNVLEDGGITVDLGTGILDSLGTGLYATVDDSITSNIGTNLVSDNLSDLTSDLVGLNIFVVPDTGVNLGFDLLSGEDASDGNDISIAGIDTPVISLDPVESIVGDIDIDIDLPTGLSDPDTLLGVVEDLAENMGDIALADPEDFFGILTGQGAEGALDIIAGDTVLDEDLDSDSVIEDLQGVLNIDDAIGGANIPDISLDPVEGIVGGIGGDLPVGLSDPDTLLGVVEDLVENIGDIALDDPEGILGAITGEGGESVLDIVAGDAAPDEDLQSLLNIGDDLNIDDAIDMLAPDDGGLAGGIGDISDDSGWTENTIDAGGLFDDIVGGIGGIADALPDPGGTVSEGLGVLNVEPVLDIGGLGGLFG